LPVVAVGDYNFDWSVENGDQDHDQGYDNMIKNGIFTWVRPATLIRSQCSETFDSVLDFVFTSTSALGWQKTSEIVTAANDCPDNNTTPDHRPVRAVLNMIAVPEPTVVTKEQLLQRITEIEAELARLKDLVRRLP